MEGLKRSRGGLRSALTKLMQKIKTAMEQKKTEEVAALFEQMKERELNLKELD